MKKILLTLALCFPLLAFSQTNQHHIYNIVYFSLDEEIKIYVDNGKEIKRLKKDGKQIKFTTTAAALMYFISEGWELYKDGVTVNGYVNTIVGRVSGITASTPYWIIRKPCTKEELDEKVKEGIKYLKHIYLLKDEYE